MRFAAVATALAMAVGGPALAQDLPTVAPAFTNTCVAEAIPNAGICRVVGTATLQGPGGAPMSWSLYDLVSGGGRQGLSVVFDGAGKVVAKTPVPARAVDAWSRNPYVVASLISKDGADYMVTWVRGDDAPAAFSVHRFDGGNWVPIDTGGVSGAVDARLSSLTAADCYPIGADISWRSFGLRYDMMGDNGSCGIAFLELGVENNAVKITDALVVRNDPVTPKRRHRPRTR
ncbi:MAG TPA: hypothetical protein VF138_12120 [Caulobacteraceae bacterium]